MTPSPYMNASADISPDGVYRYSLARRLSPGNRAGPVCRAESVHRRRYNGRPYDSLLR